MIQLSNTSQGGTYCSLMHWEDAPAEAPRRSSWTCVLTMLPLTRPGLPNWRKWPGRNQSLEQSISSHSILPGWPGHIGTSGTSYPQIIWWLVTERTMHCHTILPPWRAPWQISLWPPVSQEGPGECQTTPVLAQTGCWYYRLHKKMPGMYREPLQAHDVPQQPWERIVMNHFCCHGRLYLLVSDYFNKFPFIFQTKSTSSAIIKDHLEELFSLEATPKEIMSDNGPPFSSKEFNCFLSGLGIKHTTSSPNYPPK